MQIVPHPLLLIWTTLPNTNALAHCIISEPISHIPSFALLSNLMNLYKPSPTRLLLTSIVIHQCISSKKKKRKGLTTPPLLKIPCWSGITRRKMPHICCPIAFGLRTEGSWQGAICSLSRKSFLPKIQLKSLVSISHHSAPWTWPSAMLLAAQCINAIATESADTLCACVAISQHRDSPAASAVNLHWLRKSGRGTCVRGRET